MTKPAQPTKPEPATARRVWYIQLIFGTVALGVAYLLASLAIDSGSLAAYVATAVFAGLGVRHYYRAIRALTATGKAHAKHE